jgi:serine/threonine-protein kinase
MEHFKKSLLLLIKEFFWTLPFIFFIVGYQAINLFYKTHSIQTPCLIGKTLQQSLEILADSQLNTRLIKEKEDTDIEEGIVLNQNPAPGQNIKPHQTIFLVASKHPTQKATPQIQGLFYDDIIRSLKEQKIRFKSFFLESNHPEGLCIGQIPEPGQKLAPEGLILYFATTQKTATLFPSFEGLYLEQVASFLESNGIKPKVFHTRTPSKNHDCSYCIVKEQKPLPGSFVNLKNSVSVQLKV